MSEKIYVIEIPKDIYDKISAIKNETGKSKRFIVKEIFETFLKDNNDE